MSVFFIGVRGGAGVVGERERLGTESLRHTKESRYDTASQPVAMHCLSRLRTPHLRWAVSWPRCEAAMLHGPRASGFGCQWTCLLRTESSFARSSTKKCFARCARDHAWL